MNKLLLRSLVLIVMLFVFTSQAFAVSGAATKYEVKITKFELYNSDTAEWVTVYSGLSSALDIASGTSGQSVGSFMSGLEVADGTYTQCRITPSTAFRISAADIGGYHTTAETGLDDDGRTVSVASNTGTEAACDTVVLTSDLDDVATHIYALSPSIKVTNGIADHKVRVYFSVSTALALIDRGTWWGICPNSPSVTVSVENP